MARPHLLVTTDLSPTSLRALDVAKDLLRRTGGHATLLYVQTGGGAASHGGVVASPSDDPATQPDPQGFQAKLRQLVPQLGDAPAETVVLHGQVAAPLIVDWARRHEVDMIVIASRGHTAVTEVLLGSTAKAVLRKSPIPVLLCPSRPVPKKR